MGPLEINVSIDYISQSIEILRYGEKWFKVMKFQLTNCDQFLKEEHRGEDMTNGVPKTWLLEKHEIFLYVIHKYFTCDGRFNLVYQYHFRLLLHLIRKYPI